MCSVSPSVMQIRLEIRDVNCQVPNSAVSSASSHQYSGIRMTEICCFVFIALAELQTTGGDCVSLQNALTSKGGSRACLGCC